MSSKGPRRSTLAPPPPPPRLESANGADGNGVARAARGRRSKLLIAIVVITLLGLADAGYLTYVHYNGLGGLICLGAHHGHSSCETVQSSTWSKLDGVPVALLGLVGYISILASLWLRGDAGRALTFAIALIGCGFSAYLTYREIHSIHAICEWCVGSATFMTLLMLLTGWRFLSADISAM